MNNLKSTVGIVKYGVPQGSLLRQLLFNIYLKILKKLKCFCKLYRLYRYKHETSLKAHMG